MISLSSIGRTSARMSEDPLCVLDALLWPLWSSASAEHLLLLSPTVLEVFSLKRISEFRSSIVEVDGLTLDFDKILSCSSNVCSSGSLTGVSVRKTVQTNFDWRSSLYRSFKSNSSWATTPQINDLIGWMRQNNRASRAARLLVPFFWRSLPNNDVNFSYLGFWWQSKPAAVKFFNLCLYMKTIPAKQAEVHFSYFIHSE